jgi:hypothetical protein
VAARYASKFDVSRARMRAAAAGVTVSRNPAESWVTSASWS